MRPHLYLILISMFLAPIIGMAASGITYHGRILRSNGDPVTGQFVGFRLRVMDGNTGVCQMYEEIQTKDMRTSAGVFSIVIGDGSVVGTYGTTGITFFDGLFQNSKTYNFAVGHACEFSPYSADARHGRKLNASFRESPTDPWEDMPVMNIEHVPFAYSALTAQKVGNHGDGSLLRVENAGTPSAVTALTPTQYTNLMSLANGASTQYVQSVLGTASQITVNTVAGVATLGLADVATAGSYGSATQVPVFTLDAKGRITSVTNTTIIGAAPTGAAGGDLSGTYPNPDIAALAVGTAELAAGGVTDAKLATDSVTTVKILNANVTLAKLAADSVDSSKIVDGSITGADISSTANLSVASVSATGAVSSDSVSTRSMGLFELPVNGTNYVAHKAQDNLAGNTTYTWPAAAPGTNMILQSDNTGALSWVAQTSSPSDASYAAKGIVQFDTDAATSGITIASGIAKLANSGVTAAAYGTTAAKTVSVTVDAFGRVTAASEQDIALNASAITAGVLPIARGGTNSGTALNNNRMMVSSGGAIVEAAALLDGQIFIGSTGAVPQAATLTAGAGVTINNTPGGISISATGTGGDITEVAAGTGLTGGATSGVATLGIANGGVGTTQIADDAVTFAKIQNITDNRILGRSAGSSGDMQEIIIGTGLSLSAGTLSATATAPVDASYAAKGIVQFDTDAATSGITIASGIAKLAPSGVSANTYGSASAVPVIAVDAFGRITSATTTNIAIAASQVTSGILDIARGGTGTGTLTANRMFMANGMGTALVADTCTIGQVLEYDGSVWTCKASNTLGAGGTITALTGDVTASGTGSVAATIANSAVTNAKVSTGIDAVKLANGNVSNTEFQFLDGVTSAIQTQIDNLSSSISGKIGGSGTSGKIAKFTASGTIGDSVITETSSEIGVGTASPRATLDINGSVAHKAATSNGTSTINFGTGNLQYTGLNCQAFTLNNMKDGGSYMFVVQGGTSATCSFTAWTGTGTGSLSVKLPPDHAATTGTKHTIYNMVVLGSTVYVSWIPGY